MKHFFIGFALAASSTMASAQELSMLGTEGANVTTDALVQSRKAQHHAHTTIQTPAGEKKTYSMAGIFSNYLGGFPLDGLQQTVYFDKDEETGETTVWFQNFFPIQLDNAWTHGTLKDGRVTIPVQRIYDYDNTGDGTDIRPLSIAMLKTEGKADETTGEQKKVVGYEDSFELIYSAGHFEMPDGDRLIGLVQFDPDPSTSSGQAKMSVYSYTKELQMDQLDDAVPVRVPESAATEQYIYYFSTSDGVYDYNELNQVAIDGDDIYFNNLCPDYPGVWVKGQLTRDEAGRMTGAVVPSGQFLGYDIAYLLYFTAQTATGEYTAKKEPITEPIDEATFTYDAESKTFTLSPDQFVSQTTASGATKGIYGRVSVKYYGEDIPATPADPYGLELLDFSAYGYGVMLNFDIENKGTNGEYLNPNNLYWRAFIDKDVHEFTPEEYPEDMQDGPMTEIPYYYGGALDLGFGDTPTQRFYVFYRDTWTRAGVQAIYKVGDETFRSRIVYIDATGKVVKVIDGIDTVLAPTADTQSYYDLQGRRLPSYHSPSTSSLLPPTSSLKKGVTIMNGRKVVR